MKRQLTIGVLVVISLLWTHPAFSQDVDDEEIVGYWVMDSATHDRLLESEIQSIEGDTSREAHEYRQHLEAKKGRMYSDLHFRKDRVVEISVGVIGDGWPEVKTGEWFVEGNHVILAWDTVYKMDYTYDDGRLIFYADGGPHTPGDGAEPLALRRISRFNYNIRNNFFNTLHKKHGTMDIVVIGGLIGFIVLIFIVQIFTRRKGS